MIVIYIAGPYRARDGWQLEQNIRRAERVAYHVWQSGHVAMCPHTNSRFADTSVPDSHWLAGTMELMRRCDAVLVLPGYEDSAGTQGEIAEAQRLGMPVYELECIEDAHVFNAVAWIRHIRTFGYV